MEMSVPAPHISQTTHPLSPQVREGRAEEETSQVSSGLCNAPPIGGKRRQISAYPPWIKSKDKAEFESLVRQRTSLAGKQNAISGDPEKVGEYLALKAQMDEVAAKMEAFKMNEG